MTPEAKTKAKVRKILDRLGVYYFFPVASQWGKSGIPDIIICVRGYFFAIECKAPDGKVTPLQQKNLDAIHTSGGVTWVEHGRTLTLLELALKNIMGKI